MSRAELREGEGEPAERCCVVCQEEVGRGQRGRFLGLVCSRDKGAPGGKDGFTSDSKYPSLSVQPQKGSLEKMIGNRGFFWINVQLSALSPILLPCCPLAQNLRFLHEFIMATKSTSKSPLAACSSLHCTWKNKKTTSGIEITHSPVPSAGFPCSAQPGSEAKPSGGI